MIESEYKRQECCDEKVVSVAGREFCYADIIHAENTFAKCDIADFVEMFSCCDKLAKGDESLAYDCKVSLPGGGTCDVAKNPELCIENYRLGLAEVE